MSQFPLRLFLAWSGGVVVLSAATPLPPWYGQPNSTRQGYYFDTNSQSPAANVLENPHGTPGATIVLGNFSDGYQDPGNSIDLNGVNNDGAWDLGISGTITVQLNGAPAPPPPGSYYRFYFEVYVVSYQGITALPLFEAVGLTPVDPVRQQSLVAPDPLFPSATWEGITWTGYFDNVLTNDLTFRIKAPSNNTSVVDSLEVFTHYTLVPEPSATLFVLGATIGWASRRRRD